MLVVEEILELLKDGRWCDLDEIVEKTRLNKFKGKAVTNFLAKYGFIQIDKELRKAKLAPSTLNFLSTTQQIEEKVTAPTIEQKESPLSNL